ncbi:hypothetical protein RFN29_25760 [Mesorhizobium sp. VK22B]|uniref:Uncharacterized protein n=1 Tax=Mesorhizobium captivum TaxID=3072319 RepID=A0ABU4Z6X1_9HYPH|nr:hypothetical protein [Mesorhizobium sp. VK22B]MDX8494969.1 hypothetical protein [Mesorhizobium sp. VK22B]
MVDDTDDTESLRERIDRAARYMGVSTTVDLYKEAAVVVVVGAIVLAVAWFLNASLLLLGIMVLAIVSGFNFEMGRANMRAQWDSALDQVENEAKEEDDEEEDRP